MRKWPFVLFLMLLSAKVSAVEWDAQDGCPLGEWKGSLGMSECKRCGRNGIGILAKKREDENSLQFRCVNDCSALKGGTNDTSGVCRCPANEYAYFSDFSSMGVFCSRTANPDDSEWAKKGKSECDAKDGEYFSHLWNKCCPKDAIGVINTICICDKNKKEENFKCVDDAEAIAAEKAAATEETKRLNVSHAPPIESIPESAPPETSSVSNGSLDTKTEDTKATRAPPDTKEISRCSGTKDIMRSSGTQAATREYALAQCEKEGFEDVIFSGCKPKNNFAFIANYRCFCKKDPKPEQPPYPRSCPEARATKETEKLNVSPATPSKSIPESASPETSSVSNGSLDAKTEDTQTEQTPKQSMDISTAIEQEKTDTKQTEEKPEQPTTESNIADKNSDSNKIETEQEREVMREFEELTRQFNEKIRELNKSNREK
ncbi:MAG: hypothetical protein LBD94_01575 [Rickettsiales bacterium]|jgi:hypothetical protein|nr:hypothetical protein [Rickettsiales bacterium]